MPQPRFYSLWSINGPVDQSRLRRQMDQLKTAGLDGVVFHPRFYPNNPPYLSERYLVEVSNAILYAKSIGLAFWIYDEDGWPSGTVGGQLLKKYPQDAQRWAGLVTNKPGHCLAEFERDGGKWFLAERIGAGVDYLNPDLARHFIELTHERYRTGLSAEAFDYVEAFFCDEPEFGLGHAYDSLPPQGAIPWTPQLPQLFQQRHGEDLIPLLPLLFFSGDGASEVRIRFWELLTDIFCESFITPMNEWCRQHGKRFTAHVKGEEHPLFQVPMVGSCHQVFRHLSLPGIDALERFPSNHFFPRQVSSAARQFGDGRCMVEAFGGAGWGATPEDLERYLLWLGRHGLTDFVLHLSQYQLSSAAIRDWPPSQPLHLNWAAAYPEVLRRVRAELKRNPTPPADTLVVAPYRGIMAAYEPWELRQTNIHNAATFPDTLTGKMNQHFLQQVQQLYDAGMNYHIADERTLEAHGVHDAQGLRLGKCVYQKIVVADGAQLNGKGRHLLERVQAVGGVQKHPSPVRINVDAKPIAAALESIAVKWSLLPGWVNAVLLEPVAERSGWFSCDFVCEAESLRRQPMGIIFADAIAELTFNGSPVHLQKSEDGMIGRLPQLQITPVNTLRFRCAEDVSSPFVWLHGVFRVASRTPFTTQRSADSLVRETFDAPIKLADKAVRAPDRHTVATLGPFVLTSADGTIDGDLVPAGFPFLRSPLVVETNFNTTRPANSLQLCGVKADAARVTLNGRDRGWTWGARWEIAAQIKPGTHTLRLELIPSTYNYFGPHHYFAGDRHVISPDQFTGKKNFADPAGAPVNTHVKAWHFRSFQLTERISIL